MWTDEKKHRFCLELDRSGPSFTRNVNLSKVINNLEHEFPHVLNERIGQIDTKIMLWGKKCSLIC